MRFRRDGFTLLELLVVIAILAILIAILAPVTHLIKDRSASVLCLTNLRSISEAVYTYLHDHDNRIPRDYWYGNELKGPFGGPGQSEDKHGLWAEEIFPYISGRPWPVIPSHLETWNSSRDKYLAALFAETPLYQCPQMPPHPSLSKVTVTHPYTGDPVVLTEAPLDYAINAMRFRQYPSNVSSPRHPVTEISEPSKIIYITEANTRQSWTHFGTSDIFRKNHLWNGSSPRMANDNRHGDKIGCVFFDCHAELVELETIGIDDFVPRNATINY